MKITETIEKIFNESPISYKYIETGLTNDNYIVTLKNKKVVLRIPRTENEGLFDYSHEALVHDLIHDLDLEPKLLYYNKSTGVKCSEYIDNVSLYDEIYIERAAKLIKTLHSAQLQSGKTFDIKHEFNMFKSRIKNPIYDTSFAHHFIDDLIIEDTILCHNDLVQGNLLFSDQKDYLIDYEYAKDNDPFFDIMSFITENDIMDTSLRQKFYDVYFGRSLLNEEIEKLKTFEIVHHVLWCEWAMMMYDLHHQDIYKEIADLKYKRLLEVTEESSH